MIFGMFALFLIFAVYGMITFDLSIQEMKKLLSTRNEGFAFNMMQDLDKSIDKRIEDFRGITKERLVQRTVIESNEDFRSLHDVEAFVKAKEADIEKFDEPTPFLEDGLNMELSQDLLNTIQFYRDEYNYDVVKEIFVTNEFGANVALGYGTTDYRQDDEEWWQITKNSGIYLGELRYSQQYDSFVLPVGLRIDDNEGNFIGVMRILITLEDLIHEFVNDVEIITVPGREVILLDSEKRIIYHNGIQDFESVGTEIFVTQFENDTDVGTIEIPNSLGQSNMLSFAKSTGYRTFEGFGWTVVINQSSSSLVGEFVELRDTILLVSILGMIGSVIIGLVIAFFISQPLRELSLMALSISKGKFNVQVKKTKIDEINVISDSFNQMSDSLKKLIETEKELAEAKVRIKNERLVAIGELSASMAHDLKNPLATIRSSADIIKRAKKGRDKDIDEVLARMDRAISRISHQIEDVLNFVRITPLTMKNVQIHSIFDSALESIEIPKNIEIEFPKSTLEIKCDMGKIEIVFINLILNAIQSIGNNSGKITINVKEDSPNIIIEVIDTGDGIPEEFLGKIFDPLVTTKEKGTGLGLSTCKNIIEQHGGKVSAKNHPTTFTIILPKIDVQSSE